MELSDILSPYSCEKFVNEVWESKHLHIQRGNSRFFQDVFSLEAIAHAVDSQLLTGGDCRMAMGGEVLRPSAYLDHVSEKAGFRLSSRSVSQLIQEGATLILEAVQRWALPVRTVTQSIESFFGFPCQANAYLTPPTAFGFGAHFDTHDVIIVQVSGSKRWRLYDSPIKLPIRSQAETLDVLDPPSQEIILEPGDSLYVPRGLVHDATATNETSLHLTLGVLAPTWLDLLVKLANASAVSNLSLRRSLPPRFFDEPALVLDGLSSLTERITNEDSLLDVLSDQHASFVYSRSSVSGVRLVAAETKLVSPIDENTSLAATYPQLYCMSMNGDELTLTFPGVSLLLPDFLRECVEFVTNVSTFTVADIPGLDHDGQWVFARRMLREGFIHMARKSS